MIQMVRADDRLIHGMVAVSWTSFLGPETILVANDNVIKDSFAISAMKLAKPAGVKLIIKSKDDSVKALNNPINANKRIFLVTETIEDAFYIYERVPGITKLNIGTAAVHKKPGDTYIATLPQVFVTPKEYEFAKKMAENGVEVFAQITPSRERMEFNEIKKIMEK